MPRAMLRRHWALVGALGLIAVAAAFAVIVLLKRDQAMQQLSKERIYWSVTQAEIELHRFVADLESYGHGDSITSHDQMVRRFAIFWSRMNRFDEADIATRVQTFPGARAAIAEARQVMEQERPAVLALKSGDAAETDRLRARFDHAGTALHRLAVMVNRAETELLTGVRAQLRTEILVLAGLTIAMLSGGGILVALLMAENRANRRLASLNRQFVAAADNSDAGILLARRKSGRLCIVYVNEAVRRMAVSGADESLEGAPLDVTLARHLSAELAAALDDVLRLRHPFVTDEIALEAPEAPRFVRAELTPVIDRAGAVDAVLVELSDVSHEVAARRDIVAARDAAERANAAKSRFIAMMSHEIRTPMNGVLGALGLIAQRNRDSALDELIGTARDSGEALLAILNDVLDIARMESDRMELAEAPFAPSALVADIVAGWSPLAAEKGIALEARVDPAVAPCVLGDEVRLRQMLVNLLSNAVKFTDCGRIEIAATPRDDGRIRFAVTDTGIGIPAEDQPHLFREYDQVGGHRRGGTGLGLALVKRLATLMGGSVGVESEPGHGSRFWFDLPLAATRQSAPGSDQAVAADSRFDGLTVLVAEDNATNRMVAREILMDMGCLVIEAADGVEALEQVREARPDVVLMDISMPNMTGDEALAHLRNEPGAVAKTPVVALTAYAMRDEVDRFLAQGFDRCLAKPVTRGQLATTLAALVGRHRIAGEPDAPARDKATPVANSAAADEPAIDRAALDRLLESVGPKVGKDLVASFVSDVGSALDRVDEARQHADIAVLQRESHTLDGLGATFGVTALAETARAVNHACRRQDEAAALELADRLVVDGRAALQAFRKLTSGREYGMLAA